MKQSCAILVVVATLFTTARIWPALGEATKPYGLASRPVSRAYLFMPDRADGPMPRLLSQTGAFKSTRDLIPADGLIPYDLNVSFWSDGAAKERWVSVPHETGSPGAQVQFAPSGEWHFPDGTVFIKHFEMSTNEAYPGLRRRLETRVLVREAGGSVYGATYKWRADQTDAELLPTNLTEEFVIRSSMGTRTQTWYYPSRQDCRTCHTDKAGGVLGVKTRQLNRELTYPGGTTDNQLRAWNHIGLFTPKLKDTELTTCARLAAADDATCSLEDRARSYLDANCAQCHRPGGTVANFDARYDTPLPEQNLIDGPVLLDEGIDRARVIAPNDPWRSVAFLRVSTLEALKMPPLAHQTLDESGIALLREWIRSLPGPPVLAPPTCSPAGGHFAGPVEVSLSHTEPGVTLRYTLDGSVPTVSDPVYEKPLKVTGPTIVRAKAFKHGFTKSITVQAVYVVGE